MRYLNKRPVNRGVYVRSSCKSTSIVVLAILRTHRLLQQAFHLPG